MNESKVFIFVLNSYHNVKRTYLFLYVLTSK